MMNFLFNKINMAASMLLVFALYPGSVLAQNTTGSSFDNPLAFDSFEAVLVAILDVLVILAMPIIILFIVYAGFQYVTAQGNATKIQDASRALLYALIGGAIILGAVIIGEVIESTIDSITT